MYTRQEFISDYGNATFKHRYSVELSTREFKAKGLEWAVEQALKNDDSHIIEDSDGGVDVELGHGMSCDICDINTSKVMVFVYCECEKYIVVDNGVVSYSTDYLDDAMSRIDDESCQFVYNWKDQLFMWLKSQNKY